MPNTPSAFKRILVPLDGSTTAEQALATAADLAQRAGATLLLVHADTPENFINIEGMPVVDEDGQPVQEATHEREYLRRIEARLEQEWRISVDCEVIAESGSTAAEMLVDAIVDFGADLVAMTTHGRKGLERFLIGSVADQVIRTSHAPVLLLRPEGSDGAISLGSQTERVLVPLDGSKLAEHILPSALALADLLGAELMLMRVVRPEEQVTTAPLGLATSEPDFTRRSDQRQMEDAQGYLDSTTQSLPPSSNRTSNQTKVTTQVMVSNQIAESILEVANTIPGTLIAMTTHARTGLQRLFVGSVADKVLRGSTRPMLVLRPQDE